MKNLFLLMIIIFLISCQKESTNLSSTVPVQPVQIIVKTEQLKVSSNFNWKTIKDIKFSLLGTVDGLVEIKSSNNDTYQRAYLKKDQSYMMIVTVPTYETLVHIVYNNKDIVVNLNSNNINQNL